MLSRSWLEVTIAVLISADPRRTMSAADCAHGVEGFAGDTGGHIKAYLQQRVTL